MRSIFQSSDRLHLSLPITHLVPDRWQLFVKQLDKQLQWDRRFLLLPCGHKVDANIVRLKPEEGDVVRAQIAGGCRNNGNPFFRFHGGQYRVHIVQLIVQSWREAAVVTGPDDRVEDFWGACALKGDDSLACKVRDPDALRPYLAGLGKRYDQRLAEEKAGLI